MSPMIMIVMFLGAGAVGVGAYLVARQRRTPGQQGLLILPEQPPPEDDEEEDPRDRPPRP